MFLRLSFAIVALASIFFTCVYCSNNRINNKAFLAIVIFEFFVFIAIEYQIWGNWNISLFNTGVF